MPELRKRKSENKLDGDAAVKKKAGKAGKRKAAEDVSPVASKKQKSVKGAPVEKSASKKTEKAAANGDSKSGKKTKTKPKKDPNWEPVELEDAFEDFDEEKDEVTRDLVRDLDSESEDEAKGTDLFIRGQDVGQIPDTSKAMEAVKDSSKEGQEGRGVIYLGSIPHGFYEHEMRQYFSQFGTITNLRLSRNKKTGASKHYAFIEFEEEHTAEIVAKTMDAYLLFGHILRCKVVPKGVQHENLFKGANRRFSKVPWNKMEGRKLEQPRSVATWSKRVENEEKRRSRRAERLKLLGYKYAAPQIKAPVAAVQGLVTGLALENGKDEPGEIEKAVVAPEEAGDAGQATDPEAVESAQPAKEKKKKKGKKAPKIEKAET